VVTARVGSSLLRLWWLYLVAAWYIGCIMYRRHSKTAAALSCQVRCCFGTVTARHAVSEDRAGRCMHVLSCGLHASCGRQVAVHAVVGHLCKACVLHCFCTASQGLCSGCSQQQLGYCTAWQ
jgi:hypothetical protein